MGEKNETDNSIQFNSSRGKEGKEGKMGMQLQVSKDINQVRAW